MTMIMGWYRIWYLIINKEGGNLMDNLLGPRDKTNLTENEELEVLVAYQSAEEYLDMRVDDEDFFFDTEE